MIAWRIYTWVLGILLVLVYGVILSAQPAIVDFIDIPLSGVAWLGVWAYSYNRAIFSKKLWMAWLPLIVVWDVTYNLYFEMHLGVGQSAGNEEPTTPVEMAIGYLFILPSYLALYRLGYSSSEMWDRNGVN